jgi:hypothetical protein
MSSNQNWRYVSAEKARLSKIMDYDQVSPEDSWIAAIDGEQEEKEYGFDAHEIIDTNLTLREANIVKEVLFNKSTFSATALKFGLKKDNTYRIYRRALLKLKGCIEI